MSKKLEIDKNDLYELYVVQKKSSRDISKIYKCAYSTIDNWIIVFGFPRRSLSEAHIKTFRKNFNGDKAERAYLLGFRIGDLRVRKFYKNSTTIKIDCGSTRIDQIDHINKMFAPYGHVWIGKLAAEGRIQIECAVNESFSYLNKKYDIFPKWVLRNTKIFLSGVAGFIDAEGCFRISKDNKSAVFLLGNYNTKILNQISGLLTSLEIHHKIVLGVRKGYRGKDGYVHNNDYWILNIYRKMDLEKFSLIIKPYLRYSRKILDTNRVLDNISNRNKLYGFGRTYKNT